MANSKVKRLNTTKNKPKKNNIHSVKVVEHGYSIKEKIILVTVVLIISIVFFGVFYTQDIFNWFKDGFDYYSFLDNVKEFLYSSIITSFVAIVIFIAFDGKK